MKNLPPISCICLTYGRPQLLEEAIYSFLHQDYTGQKELIILNDYNRQYLVLDHPDIHIINLPQQFRSLGEKRNAAVALCAHDLIFVWDDDDIHLPHRLSFSVERFNKEIGFFKTRQAWVWNAGKLSGPSSNLFHSSSCFSRHLFNKVRGYPAIDSGEDQEIEARFAYTYPNSTKSHPVKAEEIYYIYRWAGTGSYHLSSFGRNTPDEKRGHEKVADYVQHQLDQGELPQGRIVLQPHWQMDYGQLVQDYLASGQVELATLPAPADLQPVRETKNVPLASKLSIGIKTFERPECALNLVESIRKFYPDILITVVDDGENNPDFAAFQNINYIKTEFYIGVSAGKNLLLEACPTEYLLFLDDDMMFTPETVLERLVEALDTTPIDIIGGKFIDVDPATGQHTVRPYEFCISTVDNILHYIHAHKGYIKQYTIYDLINNFFACKVASAKKALWDPDLKIADHVAFFINAKAAGLIVGFTDEVAINHKIVYPNKTYHYYRSTMQPIYHQRFLENYGLIGTVVE